jgi:polyhydroxyalkanoate synthesis regulator phasin
MDLIQAIEECTQAMQEAVKEGKFTESEGNKFIENINNLIKERN